MKTKQLNKLKTIWVNLCRFLLAGVFIFSGFVKAVDPLGFTYKIEDYLQAFGLLAWVPSFAPVVAAVALSTLEFVLGVLLFFGIRQKPTTTLILLFMLVMTPLTLYLAITDPVTDCGCFGDAWILTNWETFGKNVLLLIAALSVFIWKDCIIRFVSEKSEWLISLYTIVFTVILSLYCLNRLPILDFRPYKIGNNIWEEMNIPEGAEKSVIETVFVLEKDGKTEEFTLDNYPDSTWTFKETKTKILKKGYEPAIKDFSMLSLETGENIELEVLTDEGYNFLLVAHRIEQADDSNIDLINEIYDYSIENGYGFYCLTSSPDIEIEQWKDKTGAEYPFCLVDDITLKTIIRSNPGLMLIKGGTILNKWDDSSLPNEYMLTAPLDKISLGEQKQQSDTHTIFIVLLWFIIPYFIVLTIDILLVKPMIRRRKAKLKEKEAANKLQS
ncbi:BT_3928 family protein [Bacteroides sp. 519]|uniref:BT_3928 family protein n=1 Tax=Bacteroides sp. 519 TaxID=2302937 RepID=UPI0013D0CAD9|nr:BT_3928 family protein [Bacteroides sp. 519]NDV57828.1 DoxX family protein [Bacteroides sp. 519]